MSRVVAMIVVVAFLLCCDVFGQVHVKWQDQLDVEGRPDRGRSVTIQGKTVVVAGTVRSDDEIELLVRAYDRQSGTFLWQDRYPALTGIEADVYVTSNADTVYVAGYVGGLAAGTTDIKVRAYDLRSGDVLWTDVMDAGRDDLPKGLAASKRVVVVVGYGGNNGGAALNFLVRAYDPNRGTIVWQEEVDKGAAAIDAAWAVALEGNKVFVAGSSTTNTGDRTVRALLLRAYDVRNGHLLWETIQPNVSPSSVTSRPGTVFVAGLDAAGEHAYVAAFETASGDLLWRDASQSGALMDIAVRQNEVVAVGNSERGLLVVDYDAWTGATLWRDQTTPGPGFSDNLRALSFQGSLLLVAGQERKDFEYTGVLVRGYDLDRRGMMVFEDRALRSSASGAMDIAIAGRRAIVVGTVADAANPLNTDWLVRAYRLPSYRTRFISKSLSASNPFR